MRQRNVCGRVLGPCSCRFSQRRLAAAAQKVALRVLPDEQSQFNQRQFGQQLVEPQLRAFATRRQITAVASSRIAIAHRNDRNSRFIVEDVLVHAHPTAQTLAARIIPGNAGLVHPHAGRLADNEYSGSCSCAQHGPRAKRQMRFACPTSTDSCQERFERRVIRVEQRG